jgi:hypothetical protein
MEKITDEIYKELLNHIFEQNLEEFIEMISKNEELISYNFGGYNLIHYLFDNYWEEGINFYKSKNYNLDFKTTDLLLSLDGIPLYITGGQNFLHLIARKNKKLYSEIKHEYNFLQKPDLNSELPEEIFSQKNDHIYYQNRYKLVLKRNYLTLENKIPINLINKEIIKNDITKFEIDEDLILNIKNQVDLIEEHIPNSMHKYGKIIYPKMKDLIDSLICQLLPLSNIIQIHAFYIKYNNQVQKNLDKHRDDSTYTINLCLKNSSKAGKLIFDDFDYSYQHQSGKGILHSGNLYHHVEDIEEGERENIIIWIKCL